MPDAPERWHLDAGGRLAPLGAPWSVGWAARSDLRWHVAGEEPSARQRLLGGAPVVETAMRLPGGDVVHRAWAERPGAGAVAGVELYNSTGAAIAVAVVVEGRDGGDIRDMAVDGPQLRVGGRTVLAAERPPRQAALECRGAGGAMQAVRADRTGLPATGSVRCPDGRATAALVWALGPYERLRLAVAADSADSPIPPPGRLAGPDRVAAGWLARAGAGARLELPEGRLRSAVDAVSCQVLLAGPDVGAPRVEQTRRLVTLVAAGHGADTDAVLAAWLADQRRGGRLGEDRTSTAATLWALERWWRLGRRPLPAGAVRTIARAAEHVAGAPEGAVEPSWARAGLGAAAAMLAALGEHPAAARAGSWATRTAGAAGEAPGSTARRAVEAARSALRNGGDPGTAIDALLDAAGPTWTWAADDDRRPDAGVTAAAWALARALVVGDDADLPLCDDADRGLTLVRWLAPAWDAQPFEVHDIPTATGRLSYAVRWHGPRPALLWEIDGAPADVTVSAPGLDPHWSGTGPAGEALLDAPTRTAPGSGTPRW